MCGARGSLSWCLLRRGGECGCECRCRIEWVVGLERSQSSLSLSSRRRERTGCFSRDSPQMDMVGHGMRHGRCMHVDMDAQRIAPFTLGRQERVRCANHHGPNEMAADGQGACSEAPGFTSAGAHHGARRSFDGRDGLSYGRRCGVDSQGD